MKQNLTAEENEIKIMNQLVSSKVRKKRLEKKLSQLEVANLMGFISVSFYSRAESNKENKFFNLEHIYLLAKILDVRVHYLIPDSEEVERIVLKNSNKIL